MEWNGRERFEILREKNEPNLPNTLPNVMAINKISNFILDAVLRKELISTFEQ